MCEDALTALRYALLRELSEQYWEEVSNTVDKLELAKDAKR